MRKPYPLYKDSGIEWIENIPNYWEEKKLKHLVSYKNGYSFNSDDFSFEEKIPVIRIGDVNDKINFEKCIRLPEHFLEEFSSFIIKKDDILIGLTGATIGKSCKYNYDRSSLLNQRVCLLRNNNKLLNKFLYYYIKSEIFITYIFYECYGGGQDNIGREEVLDIGIFVPPIHEQKQIISFLDNRIKLLDELIEKTKQKIELLKEKRTSLINKSVTKGLNPDVEMKESEVEWIGKIPSGWEVKKLKYFAKLITEKKETEEKDIKISPENVESYTGKCFNIYSEYIGMGIPFAPGDILFNKLRLYLVKILLVTYYGYSMGEMVVIRINKPISNKFYFYLFFNQGLIDFLDSQSTGVKVPRVSPEIIMGSYLPFPPISEQQQIVEYLDSQTQKIDTLIEKENKRIELLKEYRQSLISEAVTGKIDIREEVAV